jgi:hypothetical protein
MKTDMYSGLFSGFQLTMVPLWRLMDSDREIGIDE